MNDIGLLPYDFRSFIEQETIGHEDETRTVICSKPNPTATMHILQEVEQLLSIPQTQLSLIDMQMQIEMDKNGDLTSCKTTTHVQTADGVIITLYREDLHTPQIPTVNLLSKPAPPSAYTFYAMGDLNLEGETSHLVVQSKQRMMLHLLPNEDNTSVTITPYTRDNGASYWPTTLTVTPHVAEGWFLLPQSNNFPTSLFHYRIDFSPNLEDAPADAYACLQYSVHSSVSFDQFFTKPEMEKTVYLRHGVSQEENDLTLQTFLQSLQSRAGLFVIIIADTSSGSLQLHHDGIEKTTIDFSQLIPKLIPDTATYPVPNLGSELNP